MKLSKEDFRKQVKDLGYQIRFKKVSFEGNERHIPIIKKGNMEITGGNVYTKAFFEEHKEVLSLLRDNGIFPIS